MYLNSTYFESKLISGTSQGNISYLCLVQGFHLTNIHLFVRLIILI